MSQTKSASWESRIPERVALRVIERTEPLGECLISTYASPGNRGRYATIGFGDGSGGRVMMLCHRVAWAAKHGPIAPGMTVHHRCYNTKCVNVDHMELMELFENSRRHGGAEWPLGQCENGHPNEFITQIGKGRRECEPCRRENDRRNNQRRKARRSKC